MNKKEFMRIKILLFLLCSAIYWPHSAQEGIPKRFNYQGILRTTNGDPRSNTVLNLRISLYDYLKSESVFFIEKHTVTTNLYGLYTLAIGGGQPQEGRMEDIPWQYGQIGVRVEYEDETGLFQEVANSQLLSVPFAMYAMKSGDAATRSGNVSTSATGTGTLNYLTKFTAANTIYNSQLFDNGTNVGLGTTSPSARFHIYRDATGFQEHLRMQNANTTGAGRFTLYNDGASSYATFTKYGSAFSGGYAGITTLYPLANLLAFGNNGLTSGDGLGRFLISSSGNVGISLFKSGTSKLKFHADFTTENVSIGGNALPVSRIHLNNTDAAVMELRLTHTGTGHTTSDGLVISNSGTEAFINQQENQALHLGVQNTKYITLNSLGNVGIHTINPQAAFHVDGSRDTMGYFTSNSNFAPSGILRAEYTGVDLADHVGVYARVMPSSSDNYGIGMYGEGGYIGINGLAKTSGSNTVYGVFGEAASRGTSIGIYGWAHNDTSNNLGTKYGVSGFAGGGVSNIGIYGDADPTGSAVSYAGYFNGNGLFIGDLQVGGMLSKAGGTFRIDHPLDPENKYLVHSFVESPEMMNIYSGNCVTDAKGIATVYMPEYFETLNRDFQYQLTVIGQKAMVWVGKKMNGNQFEIHTDQPNIEVSWQVTGVRQDPWAQAHRVIAEVDKPESEKGFYLHAREYGQSPAKQLRPVARPTYLQRRR